MSLGCLQTLEEGWEEDGLGTGSWRVGRGWTAKRMTMRQAQAFTP